jgi:hypothetical protein
MNGRQKNKENKTSLRRNKEKLTKSQKKSKRQSLERGIRFLLRPPMNLSIEKTIILRRNLIPCSGN